ncbi:MAG: sulfatase family protein, partial [Vicinamibacterales bacterium]
MMRILHLALTVLGLALVLDVPRSSRTARAQAEAPANIVIVLADDLGYGDLSSYGHPTIRTPHLDRMAREGIRLTSFYAPASVCTPSRAGLLTGRYAVRSGMINAIGPGAEASLPAREITLAEVLKTRGYRTGMVGKWHLGDRDESNPLEHGFDAFFGLPYSNDYMPPFVASTPPVPLLRGHAVIERPVVQPTLTARYTQEAIRFIREAGEQPFFLYLAHNMPHLPLSTSERFRGHSRAGLYGDVIEEIDWSVGQVLRTISERALDRRTIVIFTSDNGPWLSAPPRMMQAGVQRWDVGSAGALRDSKASTYEGGFRVPGVIRWPGRIPAGQVSAEMISGLDLFPT